MIIKYIVTQYKRVTSPSRRGDRENREFFSNKNSPNVFCMRVHSHEHVRTRVKGGCIAENRFASPLQDGLNSGSCKHSSRSNADILSLEIFRHWPTSENFSAYTKFIRVLTLYNLIIVSLNISFSWMRRISNMIAG